MALDGVVVSALVHEFKDILTYNRVEKIYQPEIDEIIIHLRIQGKSLKLLLSANSNYPRVHFTEVNKENPATPPNFCMLLRKYLQGSRIVSIKQPDFERIIKFRLETFDELNMIKSIDLIIEMMGRHSNIILLDSESGVILDSIKRVSLDVSRYRQVLPGLKYLMPPSQDKRNPLTIKNMEDFYKTLKKNAQIPLQRSMVNSFTGLSPLIAREICYRSDIKEDMLLNNLSDMNLENLFTSFMDIFNKIENGNYSPSYYTDKNNKYIDFNVVDISHLSPYKKHETLTISSMLEAFYIERDLKERNQQKSHSLKRNITTKLNRLYNKMANLNKDLTKAKKLDTYKLKGDLLTSNLYQVNKGDEEVEVINFYEEDYPNIIIKLDKRLSPSRNAQNYYKRYNKAKNALIEIDRQLKITQSEIDYLEQIIISIEQSRYISDLDEIHNELIETGYIKKRSKNKKIIHYKQSGYSKYISSEGFEILVGKNNKQNDEITFKISSRDDLWFHIKDMPGSHVILRVDDREPGKISLLEAANLAAYYSKAKGNPNVSIDYTMRKNVRKPRGAKPGMVIYDNHINILASGAEKDIINIEKLN